MKSPEKAPKLSFQCPKLWQEMSGSEEKRFCDTCGHHVHNLSLMSQPERAALLKRARSERVCGLYFEDLAGNLVTADSEFQLSQKMRSLRLAALAGGAIALSACSTQDGDEQHADGSSRNSTEIPLAGIICVPEDLPE